MPILEMKVPSPGESISEVEIAAWLVSDGDYVFKDQAIAEVDSDKATLERPAEMAGTITLPLRRPPLRLPHPRSLNPPLRPHPRRRRPRSAMPLDTHRPRPAS
jgi:hypothetical protein